MQFDYKDPLLLFHGKRIDVLSVEAPHPEKGTVRRELVTHPGAVVILPLLDAHTVVLIKNERFAVQDTLWELPAGTLESSEHPESCARRELLEETGFSAKTMTKLMEFFSTPGFCNEKMFVFLASDLTKYQQKLDDTEKIEVAPISLKTSLEMIHDGHIRDAKTIAALLFFHTFSQT